MDHRRDDEKLPHNSFRSQNPKPLNAPSRFHKLRLSLVREKRLRTIGPPLRIPISESHQHCVFPKPGNDSSDTNDKASTVNAKDVFEEDVEPPSPKSYLFTERDNSESVYAGEKEAVVDAKDSSETVEKRKRKADTESQENSISVSFNMESLQDQSENDGYVGLGEQEYDPPGALRIDLGANFNNKQPLSSSGANTNIKSDDDHLHKRQSEHSCLKSNASKSVVTDRSRHVQFFTPESSSGCTGMGFQNQSSSSGHSDGGIGASHDLQLQMKCERQTNPSIGGKSVLISNIREDSFQKAYEKVATDVDVRNLQTYLNSLSLTENHGGQVVSNSGQCFTNQEQSARQELYHRTLKDVAGLRKMVNDLKPTKIVIDKAGIVKPSNHAIESSSHSASTYVGASSASTQEPYSLASSCVTQNDIGNCDIQNDRKGETLKANEDLKSSHHCSERSRRQDLGDCLGTHESLFSSSCLTSANSAGAPVQCTSGTVTMLSAGPGSGSTRGQNPDTNANNNFQGEVHNVRHSGSQAASRTLEEKYCERHLLSSKESQVKGQSHMTATILEKSVQQSSSRAMSDKPVHRETNINTKKHSDAERFFKVNEKLYQKLGKIGSGGSSEVHKVIASDCTIYALKRIKLKGRDYPTAHGFFQEIEYLNKLRGKNNIIQLIDHEVTDKTLFNDVTMEDPKVKDGKITKDAYIYMVLEYGEIDLAHMLMKKWKELELENKQIDEDWLRYYWKQILKAVDTIHEERIVHSDLKPANFLLVKGVLKLIDFGIAKAIQSDTTNIQRDSQVGTLNYMSPEAFMCNDLDDNGNIIKCGRPSDIWSLGCILYQMVYGKTPFADYKSFWEKYKVITNKNHPIRYGPVSNLWLLDIMKKCLAWNRNDRLRIPQLLEHPFLKPPTVPVSFSPEEQLCKSISEISHLYESDLQVQSLCEQLHSLSEQLRACIQSKRP